MKMLHDESGQTLILAALSMALLLGFVALAVDVGLLFHARRVMQTAADSGAIAGAEEVNYGDVTAAAQADAARNGVTNGTKGATVTVNRPPLSGPHAGSSSYVEVIVSQSQSTYFMNVFGRSAVTVSARAVGTMYPNQNCVYALNPSGTDVTVSGGAVVQIPGCGLIDDSSSSTALTVSGTGSTLSASTIGIVGGYSGSGQMTPTPVTGIATVSDPLAFMQPPSFSTSSCLADPNLGGAGKTFTLGSSGTTVCYNGLTIAGGASVIFNSGVYIINGAFSISGGSTATGAGVTFYLPSGASVSISGGGTLNLTAPTSGTYDGFLFYEDRSNTNAATIAGGAGSTLQGILYFPKAGLTLTGGSSSQVYASVIAGSLTFTGGSTLNNYAIVNPSTPLTSARLVE